MGTVTFKEQVAELYEVHHDPKKGRYEYLHGDEPRRQFITKEVGSGNTVLDIGCRAGNLTQFYCKNNKVIGVDIDRNALKVLKENLGVEGHWVDLDEDTMPFPDESFDVVVFTEVMEHVRFPEKVLAEIRRVLKPTGKLVGSVPNAFRLSNRLKFLFGRHFENDPTHLRWYTVDTLRKTLGKEFREVKILPFSGNLLGGGKHGIAVPYWLPMFLRKLFCLSLVFVCRGKRESGN